MAELPVISMSENQSQNLLELNRSAPWELFSSAYRTGMEAAHAKSAIEKLHHNRAMLLFAFASIEALLNNVILSIAPNDIELRHSVERKPIKKKLGYIESHMGIAIDQTEIDLILSDYKLFRDQTAHHKRSDQLPQFHAQHMQPLKLIELLQIFFARVHLARHGEFPYWITGWNYIGFNGNWRDPYLHNNGNGFTAC